MKNRLRTSCERELSGSGITIKQMAEKKRSFTDNLFRCLWNGLIIFLFTVGLTGMFASSFAMTCSYPVLILVCAAASFAFALLYVNTAFYNAGYFLLMAVIIVSIVRLYVVVNSGYNAVLNILTEAVKEEMSLPYLRQHAEIYPNRHVTVTAFLAVIGSVLAMFFNMWVSRRKSVLAPLIVVFPVLELCIYLNDDFSYLGAVVLLLALFLFEITVKNDSVPMDKKKLQKTWHVSYGKKDGRAIVLHRERPKTGGWAASALVYAAAAVLLSALCFGFLSAKFINTASPLKKSSDKIVRTVAMHGIDGLFMRNNIRGRGGMSNGSFGDVSSVYLDYETDLEISLVPYTDRPVYLPTYTGAVYDSKSRRWQNEGSDAKNAYGGTHQLFEEAANGGEWDKYKLLDVNMLIKNIGVFSAGDVYAYVSAVQVQDVAFVAGASFSGYYSDGSVRVPILEDGKDDGTALNYYACLLDYDEYEKLDIRGEGASSPEAVYTEVPEDIREELSEICERQGFEGSRAEIISQIQDFLASDYGYTVSPGRTPSNRDFVLYFLQDKKQGFCVHFASAACLLLRTMGIPARYAEGYCFDYTVYEEATAYEGENTKWNTGYSGLDYDIPVTVELTDANAHAWVEVYFAEVGWVPVEFTVGTVVGEGGSGIMDFLGDIFGFGTEISTEPEGENFFTEAGAAIQSWFESRFGEQLLILLAAAAGVLLLRYMIYIFRAYMQKGGKRAVFQYRTMTGRARKRLMRRSRGSRDYYRSLVISPDVMRKILTDEYGVDKEYADGAMEAFERFNYSPSKEAGGLRDLTNIYARLIRIITWRRIKKRG
ncbi:MAG: transglutaminase-like domain-containing protein [Butyrivibrio sp.]|nr:transglutaminase-like domain-containing protein [Butyrivibrio sp.]